MKKTILLIILAAGSFLNFSTYATPPLRMDREKMRLIRMSLDSLDKTIGHIEEYRSLKGHRIEALRSRLQEDVTAEESWQYMDLLYSEYASFRSSDQLQAAKQLLSLAIETKEKDKILVSYLKLVQTYLWSGAFKEAQELLDRVDTAGCERQNRAKYLLTDLELQYEAGLYVGETGFFQQDYEDRVDRITDELCRLLPDNDDRVIMARERNACFKKNHSLAYKYAMQRLAKSLGQSARRAEILGNAGFYNLEMGDTLTAVSFMCRSADMSLKLGARQEPALRKIAETVYPLGEVDRAHRYINLAMENATFYGSSYRIFEASLSLPAIDRNIYGKAIQRQQGFFIFWLYTFLAFLLLLALVLVVWRQNKRIRHDADQLEQNSRNIQELNARLRQMNSELEEANLLKGAYLERNLTEDSMNISKLENLVKDIEQKVVVRQYDDIVPYIYRNNYLRTRAEMLRRFDKTFLAIFPDFVEQVNGLLSEEHRFLNLSGKKDLPVELRILALMRLGIRKSATIGGILNISDSTVRNYKTRLRNYSIGPNDAFDEQILLAIRPKKAESTDRKVS